MINFRFYIAFFIIFVAGSTSYAQIGIQTNTPDPSSALDITSTDKGLLIPRVTLTANLSSPSPVASPAIGLLIFNSGPNQEDGFYYWDGSNWNMLRPAGSGSVEGPPSSTDNAIARFDGTTGSLIQNSTVILDDAGNMTSVNSITTQAFAMPTGAAFDQVLTTDAAGNSSWQNGLSLNVEHDDVLFVPNANTLNFKGAVSVVDDGNSKATIEVIQNISIEKIVQLGTSSNLNINQNPGTAYPIPWDTQIFIEAGSFTHNTGGNSSRVYVDEDGIYEFNYMLAINLTNFDEYTVETKLRINGDNAQYIDNSASVAFFYSAFTKSNTLSTSSFLAELEAGDYVELMAYQDGNVSGSINVIPNESLIYMRVLRTW